MAHTHQTTGKPSLPMAPGHYNPRMNLRWLWFDHIPPELEVPEAARLLVMRRSRKFELDRRFRRDLWRGLGIEAAISLVGLAACIILWAYEQIVVALITFFLVVAYKKIEGSRWFRPLHMKARRLALCQLGYLCCVKCGYVHTGLSKDVKECPECGAAREFGKCIHCNSPQDWAMTPQDKCTQCGRMRLS
jgi:hypothetical protein